MKREIFLDWAATSYRKPRQVIDAVTGFLENICVSSGRGAYKKAFVADGIVYECRREAARLLGVSDPARIVFTSGATESINIVLKGYLRAGDHVVTTTLEHNSVLRPLYRLSKERSVSYTTVKCDEKGYFEIDDFKKSITERTRLFVINHVSNVTGVVLPAADIAETAHERGISVLVDAAQSAGSIPVDAAELGADFIAFAGHKSLLGLQGTGGLYIKEGITLDTLKEGGTGSDSMSPAMPENPPERFEPGTLNYPGICALKEGIRYINDTGVGKIRESELEIIRYTLDGFRSLANVRLYGCGNPQNMTGVFAFNVDGVPPDEVARVLDAEHGIMVRAGLHCAPLAHESMGTLETGTVRASIGHTTTKEEIDIFIDALGSVK